MASLKEGEWSRGGQFSGERMVMLQKWSLIKEEWSCYRITSLMEGEWSCYGGGQFKGGRMVMLQRWII